MVARSPPKQQRKMVVVAAPPRPVNPTLLRETVKKVDKCMARLQELQYTVSGGRKVIPGVSLSPKTSFRCKQESLRIKNANSRRSSPPGKLPTNTEEWRRMSLPAMLLGETVEEILKASQFARNIVEAVAKKPTTDEPITPVMEKRKQKPTMEHSEIHARRKREKQVVLQTIRSESHLPSLQRAKSRITFKASSSSPMQERRHYDKENCSYIANRVSPRNRPWARKTVLFPNPLFHSSPTSKHQKFSKTKSPVIARNRQTPHKFLIKSPPSSSKFQVKIKSHPLTISPTRATSLGKKSSPKALAAAKLRGSFSPLRNRNDVKKYEGASSSTAAKLRRSFSPSRLANRLVSPLKARKSVQKNDGMNIISGLKQRPTTSLSVQVSPRRI